MHALLAQANRHVVQNRHFVSCLSHLVLLLGHRAGTGFEVQGTECHQISVERVLEFVFSEQIVALLPLVFYPLYSLLECLACALSRYLLGHTHDSSLVSDCFLVSFDVLLITLGVQSLLSQLE